MSLSVGIINYFTGAILTFRILYIMFNFVWTFIYKIYDVSVWSTNHVEPLWDFSNRSVYILLVFRAVFIYIIFIVWHYESYHLYCVVRAIFSPCLAMYMYMYIWPRNTSSLSVTHRPFVSVTLVASKLTQDTYQTG